MRSAAKIQKPEEQTLIGLFSKREAAEIVVNGCRHIHSSLLGGRDACALITQEALGKGIVPRYPWELVDGSTQLKVASSQHRFDVIHRIADESKVSSRRETRERVHSVLEELFTNAIYHASTKYPRHKPVSLPLDERVSVRFAANDTGIYLSVTDLGGTLVFDSVTASLKRCYGESAEQIEGKEGGAGLGLYLIFEAASHVKIVTEPGARTEVSCWIADKRNFDPDHFSFNFFEGRKP